MIEKSISDYLDAELEVSSFMEEPEEKADAYVLVERTGGDESVGIATATVAIQSYGPSLYEAALLNDEVKEKMRSAVANISELTKCKLNSSYNFTDPETHRYRYQAVYDLTYYEE